MIYLLTCTVIKQKLPNVVLPSEVWIADHPSAFSDVAGIPWKEQVKRFEKVVKQWYRLPAATKQKSTGSLSMQAQISTGDNQL